MRRAEIMQKEVADRGRAQALFFSRCSTSSAQSLKRYSRPAQRATHSFGG